MISEKAKNDVYYKRKACLDNLFIDSRRTNCYFQRIELKNRKIIDAVIPNIIQLINESDRRFLTAFHIRSDDVFNYEVFVELNLGYDNPSVYLFKAGKWSTKVAFEAESKDIWRKMLTYSDDVDMHFLNASALRCHFHRLLDRALTEFNYGGSHDLLSKDVHLKSVELDGVAKMIIEVSNYNGKKIKKLNIDMIPTIIIPVMCLPYVKQCYGDVIPTLVAKQSATEGEDPELLWPLSYHMQEQYALDNFPMFSLYEAFHGTLNICKNDPILKKLSREAILHIFLEIGAQTRRWIEVRYDDVQQLKEEDSNYMMEFFFTDLLQKLESSFIQNHFNPEINLIEFSSLNATTVRDLACRVKIILRGNCECCLLSMVKKISNDDEKEPVMQPQLCLQLPSYISSAKPRECNVAPKDNLTNK